MPPPRFSNRLVQESSPYLLQHAHNPVDWYPWGEEGLGRARSQDIPIFLSIGYSACHWCHVMEHECFENEQIASVMNENFVNIKVDREERPDLDEIYMLAVQALTGSGGWPMSVFLTPNLEPFYGGTYFPPDDRYGRPGFPKVLQGVANFYRTRREEANGQARKLREHLESSVSVRPSGGELGAELVESAYRRIAGQYDHTNGGFGSAPKFPGSMSLAFFLRYFKRTGAANALEMATYACRKMAHGGVYDHLGGGFHRYSVDERWLVPHFEKMLYDNALLSSLYLEAYQATGDAFFRQTVAETLDYVIREMTGPEGGFYSTQDADSEGVEGKFFVWTPEEVEEVLGEEDSEIFCRYFDVTPHGNFEHGTSILNTPVPIEGIANLLKEEPDRVREVVEAGRRRLFGVREKRIKPGRDEKVLVSWNGLMISSLARAFRGVGDTRYLNAAVSAADFTLDNLCVEGRLLHTWKDGKARLSAYLDDYAFLVCGLVDLYEAAFDLRWLTEAIRLAEEMVDQFWDDEGGTFYFTGRHHEKLLLRSRNPFDNAIPSGNSTAALGLLRLGALTGRRDLVSKAEGILRFFRNSMAEAPGGFAHMLCALDFYLSGPVEVAIIGDRDASDTVDLLRAVHSRFLPGKVVCHSDQGSAARTAALLPLLHGKVQVSSRATAYVCRNSTCSVPVTAPEALGRLLDG